MLIGSFRGAKPLFIKYSPSPFKERDTNGESKRGGASLLNPSPFPSSRGRGIKGDGVTNIETKGGEVNNAL
ncbi:hypothetical protein ES703_69329 [subsurface metagenome]